MKIKKSDRIKVTAGKDKGREGVVEKVLTKKGKVIISGINLFKKHVKPMPGRQGGIVDITRPLPMGNVALICPSCAKPTRVGYKEMAGKRVRICRKCQKEIDK